MISKERPILIVSWSVFPAQGAMSLLIHNLAKVLGEKCIVFGEISNDSSDWDDVNYRLIQVDTRVLQSNKGIRYQKWLKFRSFSKQLSNLIKEHNCVAVLSPFPDEFFLALGCYSAKKANIPFFPWFHNTYKENRSGILLRVANTLQPYIFRNSKKVLTISDGLSSFYRKKYKEIEVGTLKHGFFIPKSNIEAFKFPSKGKVKFAYSGAINESCKDSARRLCKIIANNPEWELHVFGNKNLKILNENGVSGSNVISYGFLQDDEFNKALALCHVMLLPHGFKGGFSEIEYETIFPTRTIPLLYSNRPILLHSPPNAFLTKFFLDNKCGDVISISNVSEIELAIKNFISNNNEANTYIENARKCLPQFDINNIADQVSNMV